MPTQKIKIFEISEIRDLIPELVKIPEIKVQMFIDTAIEKICFFLHKKELSDELLKNPKIKIAAFHLIRHEFSLQKETAGMAAFKQGNISVNYESAESRTTSVEVEVKKILTPIIQVKVWS
ncbi:MAG: hypothetical protein Q4A35_00895 [Candidatus Gracilibacteria bacterium]|nr:hypothetical protein [Candidatus Gracilibacteria bacterium]